MQNNNTIGLKELRENMETYINKVKNGEQITVFRRSTPLFTINPIHETTDDWETITNLTDVHKDGISAREILKSLKKMHGQKPKVS